MIFTLLMSGKVYWHSYFSYLLLFVIYAALVNLLVFSHYLDTHSLLSAVNSIHVFITAFGTNHIEFYGAGEALW